LISKTLQLIFKDDHGKTKTLLVKDPKDDIKASEVRPVMEELITNAVFINGENKLTTVGGMRMAYVQDLE